MRPADIIALVAILITAGANVAVVAYLLGTWRQELADVVRRLEDLERK